MDEAAGKVVGSSGRVASMCGESMCISPGGKVNKI